jgi:hypothetical protein
MDTHPGGSANINSYSAAESGTVGHLSAFLMMGTTTTVYLGLYDNSGSQPNSLLTFGTIHPDWTQIINAGGAWVTVAVDPPVCVTQGQTYWIAILCPYMDGNVGFGYYSSPPSSFWQHSASSDLSVLPPTWTASTIAGMHGNSTECSMYASP